MTEESDDGILTVAVSDPTMKNTGSITVDIERPAEEVVSHDENVDVLLTDNGVRLVVHTKGTNGTSSCASVRVTSPVTPPTAERVVKLITLAAEAAEAAGDYGEEEVIKAVKEAIAAVWEVSNEELAEYCMDELLVLEELYRGVMSAGRDSRRSPDRNSGTDGCRGDGGRCSAQYPVAGESDSSHTVPGGEGNVFQRRLRSAGNREAFCGEPFHGDTIFCET